MARSLPMRRSNERVGARDRPTSLRPLRPDAGGNPNRGEVLGLISAEAHSGAGSSTYGSALLKSGVGTLRSKPAACREHHFRSDQSGDALLQKLDAIAFTLDEEESLTLPGVTRRTRSGFDVERVTKRFYEQFKKEHGAFLKFITGIPESAHHEWYASVMLNRLMFVYFIQRKGFLDDDRDYLRNRLSRCQKEKGQDKFYSFYRFFLLRLFHEGLGGKARTPALEKLLGRIPYLNGGLFERHQIEKDYQDIAIPDKAFERIFSYFDQYQWHLDERPLRADNEINPDVLGYIFEKYINQKQMGAYYTKEDITEYIGLTTGDAQNIREVVALFGPLQGTRFQLATWRNRPDDVSIKVPMEWDCIRGCFTGNSWPC